MTEKKYGHPLGVAVGATFASRAALVAAGVHPHMMNGIHGTRREGADAIVVGGAYVDDADLGDVIIFTGEGGRDMDTGRQVADQDPNRAGNAGLVTSQLLGLPVRVIRKADPRSPYAPAMGFRYDGLFNVTNHWVATGKDGFSVVQFRLEQLNQVEPSSGPAPTGDAPTYATTTVTRRIRDSAMARTVKAWHQDRCQVCGVIIAIPEDRRYSEGAHVRPLGKPHVGPDDTSNILCLCPNHHAQLDNHGLTIADDYTVTEVVSGKALGVLRLHPKHVLDPAHLEYHRAMQ